MITQSAFAGYQAQAAQRKYSSLQYAEYADCRAADAVYADGETLVLCDFTQTPAMINFAANDFHRVIDRLRKINGPLRMNFTPHDFKQELMRSGFEVWAEFADYVHVSLQDAPVKRCVPEDLDYMKQSESEQVSQLSKRCAGQSRGFYGEETAFLTQWMEDGNHVILVRDQEQIAGFCCVSIYEDGTTLWIREVAVDPAFQGRGYGKRLVEQAIGYGIAKGAVKGFLAVDITNQRAISIYRKYGFSHREEACELQMVRH